MFAKVSYCGTDMKLCESCRSFTHGVFLLLFRQCGHIPGARLLVCVFRADLVHRLFGLRKIFAASVSNVFILAASRLVVQRKIQGCSYHKLGVAVHINRRRIDLVVFECGREMGVGKRLRCYVHSATTDSRSAHIQSQVF
ncbi:hypothetical protein V565_078000 [Rhizoctonia solani 123E]|uniref:Uncharacterized protein n=1 Tax=Rhizoctonia solani 123E TaxID=1423351 RepID=A0A074SKG3_9AGAM|nr:hypothetical protein V565_078000 [Rhizoctonia solani 123E]